MLTLNDGRSELWQWDTGRMLSVDADCSQVHFSNKVFGRSIDVDVVDGVASIPDVLLQTDKELTAWAFVGTPENGYTKISKIFKVNKRNKPADYVFTATDQTTLGEILDRIEDLENRPSGDVSKEDIQNAVNDYLDKNPVSFEEKDPTVPAWAKKPNKPTYTAAEVGALPVDTVIPEGGIPIPPTASVGQTIVVKAVDESGKPTEWEAADFPSGGGMPDAEEWELINSVTLTAEDAVSSIYIDKRQNGEDFEYDELCLRCNFSATSVSEGRFLINRSESAWGQYIKIPNFFVTNTQGNQYTFFRLLIREGNFSVFQSITTRNNQNFIASKEAVLRKKMHSFYLATNANTTYMIGSYKLYGRNY